MDQPKDFPQKVIWLDEKLWEEKVRINNQNKRIWGLSDPEFEDEEDASREVEARVGTEEVAVENS